MYVLMNNNTVIPLQEIDVANVHDGDVLMYSWNKQYLEEIGMNLEWNKAQDIVEQYLPVSVIMDEKDFGWLERMMTRAKHNDHTPVKTIVKQASYPDGEYCLMAMDEYYDVTYYPLGKDEVEAKRLYKLLAEEITEEDGDTTVTLVAPVKRGSLPKSMKEALERKGEEFLESLVEYYEDGLGYTDTRRNINVAIEIIMERGIPL